MQEAYPADTVSLRSVTSDNFVIVDTTGNETATDGISGEPEVIGEVDFSSALTTVHPKAIYLHQGQQYHVEQSRFRPAKGLRQARRTWTISPTRFATRRCACSKSPKKIAIAGPAARVHGDVLVRSQVIGFKKIKFFTNENVGAGKLELPENEMHTTAFWITLDRSLVAASILRSPIAKRECSACCAPSNPWPRLLLMCDPRDLGTAIGERPPSPGIEPDWQR